jgi:hypothetical protein
MMQYSLSSLKAAYRPSTHPLDALNASRHGL